MREFDRFRQADTRRALLELAVTLAPFVLLWIGMATAVRLEAWWLYGLLMLPTAGLLVRLFMIQHDCGHGSFFPRRQANDWVGRAMGVLTLTPYDHWRRSHAIHHASCGNLDRRGIGDVDTLTTGEYLALGRWGRLRYRLYRHPAVMFGLGPSYLFVLQNRLPLGFMSKGWMPWVSTMGTNAALLALVAALTWAVGASTFLVVHLPIVVLAATAGVWLFYIQHQFEETHWDEAKDWSFHDAALHGSSHYDLPPVLRWFTGNIGIHHVHHLASRIPFYRLPEVLRSHPELGAMGRVTLLESFRCVRLTLWDTANRRMVSFRELVNGDPAKNPDTRHRQHEAPSSVTAGVHVPPHQIDGLWPERRGSIQGLDRERNA
ncbi:MAG TPA: fatty acid desaturase [Mesorhizobium sp.]|jgi:omega-6 fatty acid desaturase (delta-12 desaturase)|nr:fatty acid desaturase [Mesorhizobium sp.]